MRQAMAVIRDSLHDDVDGLREAMLELDVRRSLDNASPGDSLLLPSEPSESDPHSRSASLTSSQHGSRGAELHKAASQDVHAPSGLSQAPLASLNAAAEASERETAAGAANGRGAAEGGASGGGQMPRERHRARAGRAAAVASASPTIDVAAPPWVAARKHLQARRRPLVSVRLRLAPPPRLGSDQGFSSCCHQRATRPRSSTSR